MTFYFCLSCDVDTGRHLFSSILGVGQRLIYRCSLTTREQRGLAPSYHIQHRTTSRFQSDRSRYQSIPVNTSRSKLESETDATADGLSTLGRPWKSGHVLRVQGGRSHRKRWAARKCWIRCQSVPRYDLMTRCLYIIETNALHCPRREEVT